MKKSSRNSEMNKTERNLLGFSLVEVIITVGIISIVMLIVFNFMATSSKTYNRTSADVDLQEEAQLVANNIKDIIIDCQVSTDFFDETDPYKQGADDDEYPNALLINNEDTQILLFEDDMPNSSTKGLYYVSRSRSGGVFPTEFNMAERELLAEYVDSFYVDTSRYKQDRIIEFSFEYKLRGRAYDGTYQVYMRNPIKIDRETNYPSSDTPSITQVLVAPSKWYIEPDRTAGASATIASPIGFTYSVKRSGGASGIADWSLGATPGWCEFVEADHSSPTITIKVTNEPQEPSFILSATARDNNSKAGYATVYVRKVEGVAIRCISGLNQTVNGVEAANENGKVSFVADVAGWNLQQIHKTVKWKLEYRTNYEGGEEFKDIVIYQDGAYKKTGLNILKDIATLSDGGLVSIGADADSKGEFRITATADYPDYREPYHELTYQSARKVFRVNKKEKEKGAFPGLVRGANADIYGYFESGQCYLDGYLGGNGTSTTSTDEAKQISKLISVEIDDSSSEILKNVKTLIKFVDGVFYFDYDAIVHENAQQLMRAYQSFNIVFKVTFMNPRGETKTETVNMEMKAVSLAKAYLKQGGKELSTSYVVIPKGSSAEFGVKTTSYNIQKANQLAVYDGTTRLTGDGNSGMNRYLNTSVIAVDSSGNSLLGTKDKYVDTAGVKITATSTDGFYPAGGINLKVALEDLYLASGGSSGEVPVTVYIANVKGKNIYIPGPSDTVNFNKTITGSYQTFSFNPMGLSGVQMKKDDAGKYYMTYDGTTYTYDTTYRYWK